MHEGQRLPRSGGEQRPGAPVVLVSHAQLRLGVVQCVPDHSPDLLREQEELARLVRLCVPRDLDVEVRNVFSLCDEAGRASGTEPADEPSRGRPFAVHIYSEVEPFGAYPREELLEVTFI